MLSYRLTSITSHPSWPLSGDKGGRATHARYYTLSFTCRPITNPYPRRLLLSSCTSICLQSDKRSLEAVDSILVSIINGETTTTAKYLYAFAPSTPGDELERYKANLEWRLGQVTIWEIPCTRIIHTSTPLSKLTPLSTPALLCAPRTPQYASKHTLSCNPSP